MVVSGLGYALGGYGVPENSQVMYRDIFFAKSGQLSNGASL